MKKFLALVLGVLVAVGAIFMTACGDATFSGDYSKEADEETAVAAFNSVSNPEGGSVIGDTSKEDWKFGVKVKVDADAKITGVQEKDITVKANGELLVNINKEGFSGSVSAKLSGSEGIPAVDFKGYTDGVKAYGNGKLGATEINKEYITIAEYINLDAGSIMQMIGYYAGNMLPGGLPDMEGLDGASIYATLTGMGAKVYVDSANGTKIKVSFDKDAIFGIIGQFSDDVPAAMLEAMKGDATIDVYVAFDANGLFLGCKLDVNINLKLEAEGVNTMSFYVKATFEVKYTTENVSVPGDLNSYKAAQAGEK